MFRRKKLNSCKQIFVLLLKMSIATLLSSKGEVRWDSTVSTRFLLWVLMNVQDKLQCSLFSTVLSFPLQTVTCFLAIPVCHYLLTVGDVRFQTFVAQNFITAHSCCILRLVKLNYVNKCNSSISGTCSCSCWSHCPMRCDSASPEHWTGSWEDLFLPGSWYHHQNLQRNHWNFGTFDNNL